MITVKFSCDGCHTEVNGTSFLKSEFHGVTGKSHGFGHWENELAEDMAPEGWIAFDPYTRCTYCPDCWQSIFADCA